MNKCYRGGCHCGTIQLALTFASAVSEINPRACNCDFCYKHGAEYVADPKGQVEITYRDSDDLVSYGQPGQLTRYLFCGNCGCLVGLKFAVDQYLLLTVNGRLLADIGLFAKVINVSPKPLSLAEKIQRWQAHWFQDVTFKEMPAS